MKALKALKNLLLAKKELRIGNAEIFINRISELPGLGGIGTLAHSLSTAGGALALAKFIGTMSKNDQKMLAKEIKKFLDLYKKLPK